MGATFVVVLREGFEAALLLGIVYAYLAQIGHAESRRYVTLGGALAVLASIAMGVGVSVLSGPLADVGPDVIAIAVIFVAVVLLTWHGWWMGRHAREIRGDLQRRVDAAHASQQLWMVGLIAFTGVFREGAETVLFLWGLMTQLQDVSGWTALAGGAAGLVTAAVLGWLVFQGGRRLGRATLRALGVLDAQLELALDDGPARAERVEIGDVLVRVLSARRARGEDERHGEQHQGDTLHRHPPACVRSNVDAWLAGRRRPRLAGSVTSSGSACRPA